MSLPTLQTLLSTTPQGRAILAKMSGDDDGLSMGKGKFLPGLMKPIKKIGKVTSRITTGIAKAAAGLIGIPPSAIDALAKVDPTAHAALVSTLAQKGTVEQLKQTAQKTTGKIKPLYIGIAAGGAALVLLFFVTKKKR